MLYTEETARRLDAVITDTSRWYVRLIWYAVAAAMILYGWFMGMDTPVGIIFLIAGCILLPAVKRIPSLAGNRVIQAMRNKQLQMSYVFLEDGFASRVGGGGEQMEYSSVTRLVKDESFYYLFQNGGKACMMEKGSVRPKDPEAFERFMEKKTGLTWTTPSSLGKLTLAQILNRTARKTAG